MTEHRLEQPDPQPADADRPRCTARSKQSQERCRNRPRPGYDVCRIHGVGGPLAHGLHTVKHGYYSRTMAETLRQRAQELSIEMDPRDLSPEIALVRALIERFIDDFEVSQKALIKWYLEDEEERPMKLPSLVEAVTLVKALTQASATLVKNREKEALPLEVVKLMVREMERIVRLYVLDPEALGGIRKGWQEIEVGTQGRGR